MHEEMKVKDEGGKYMLKTYVLYKWITKSDIPRLVKTICGVC